MANKIRKKHHKVEELNLKPFMNLMITLVPLLVVTAEFSKIATIDVTLPEGRGSDVNKQQQTRAVEDPDENKLLLTIVVADSGLTIMAKNGMLPTIWYKEYHDYVSKENSADKAINFAYDPSKLDKKTMIYPESMMPTKTTGKKFTIYERQEINLVAENTNDNNQYIGQLKGLYNKKTLELLVNKDGAPLQTVKSGDSVFSMDSRMTPVEEVEVVDSVIVPRKGIKVENPADYELMDLSAYDYLKSILIKVREQYPDAEDKDNLIIAAEDQIAYDKIVQIMDAAKACGIPKISISKLRS